MNRDVLQIMNMTSQKGISSNSRLTDGAIPCHAWNGHSQGVAFEDMAAYLEAVLEDGDPALVAAA